MTKPGPKPQTSIVANSDALKGMTTKDALAYWLAVPTKSRNPVNQKGLAQLLGVSEERLCQIKREDGFMEQVQDYRKTFFKQFTSDIIASMTEAAKLGNERAAKLFLQYIEDFKETTRQEKDVHERREFVLLLGEEKLAELRKVIEEERKKLTEGAIDAEIVSESSE